MKIAHPAICIATALLLAAPLAKVDDWAQLSSILMTGRAQHRVLMASLVTVCVDSDTVNASY